MQKMGKRKKQTLTQFAVDILFLATGIIVGFVTMLVVGLITI